MSKSVETSVTCVMTVCFLISLPFMLSCLFRDSGHYSLHMQWMFCFILSNVFYICFILTKSILCCFVFAVLNSLLVFFSLSRWIFKYLLKAIVYGLFYILNLIGKFDYVCCDFLRLNFGFSSSSSMPSLWLMFSLC